MTGCTRTLLPLAIAAALAACATAPTPDPAPEQTQAEPWEDGDPDFGPETRPDLGDLRDPTPRDKPRSRWGNPESYEVFGVTYRVMDQGEGYVEEGIASWYGKKFHGRRTSSGERYDMYALTAAHKELPIPIYARVTNLENDLSVVVKINDRGPFARDRIIDLSYAAADRLDMVDAGTAPVRVETLSRNLDADAEPAPPRNAGGAQNGIVAASDRGGDRTPEIQAAPRVESSVSTENWYLQVGAFGERTNAERLKTRLAAEDVGPVLVRTGDGQAPHRVWIGPMESRDDAEDLRHELVERGLGQGQVVSPENAR